MSKQQRELKSIDTNQWPHSFMIHKITPEEWIVAPLILARWWQYLGQVWQKNRRQRHEELECGLMPNVMSALSNIGGDLCESSVIPFLVPRRKVWLMSAAEVPCSNAANIGERKTWTLAKFRQGVRAPENVHIVCQRRDGQTSCKVWLASGERRRCSNKGKRRTRWY